MDAPAVVGDLDLLGDRSLACRLSEGAQERGKGYDWEVLAERVLAVYRGVTVGRS